MVAHKLSPSEWERSFQAAFQTMRAKADDPLSVSAGFEPLLSDVFFHKNADRVVQLRQAAKEAVNQLGSFPGRVSLEVRHLCWHVQHQGEESFVTSSVIYLYVMTKRGFQDYQGHLPSRCPICAEYPGDNWITAPKEMRQRGD